MSWCAEKRTWNLALVHRLAGSENFPLFALLRLFRRWQRSSASSDTSRRFPRPWSLPSGSQRKWMQGISQQCGGPPSWSSQLSISAVQPAQPSPSPSRLPDLGLVLLHYMVRSELRNQTETGTRHRPPPDPEVRFHLQITWCRETNKWNETLFFFNQRK